MKGDALGLEIVRSCDGLAEAEDDEAATERAVLCNTVLLTR